MGIGGVAWDRKGCAVPPPTGKKKRLEAAGHRGGAPRLVWHLLYRCKTKWQGPEDPATLHYAAMVPGKLAYFPIELWKFGFC